jgi:D-lactate dehydrogenase
MKIVHFDVDSELDKYLQGEKYSYSLQEIKDQNKFADAEVLTIKLQSEAKANDLEKFPKLKLFITRTVGTDHIDLEYCKEKGIAVYHIVDYGSFNIAEHVFALLLSGTRNILHSQKEIQNGVFSYNNHLGIALKGKTIGIVGTGKIGLETIKRAKGFEMEVVAYDVFKNEKAAKELGFPYLSLEDLAATSDIISLHAPLLESTKHMVNEKILKNMKQGAILINTARGGLIDTNALVNHIEKFRWVGLDVLEDEQEFSKNHSLLKFSNVVITPHIAFFSDASTKRIAEETLRLIKNFEEGNIEGRVV